MSITIQEIMCDAKEFVERLTDQEKTADNLYSEMQSIVCHLNNVKQYQEEVEMLSHKSNQKPHLQLIAEIQHENKYIQEIQAENGELRLALKEHQNALDLIMSKYRQQTSSLIKNSNTNLSLAQNAKYTEIIRQQAEKINEMAAVMKHAASIDEKSELEQTETYARLVQENKVLRELVDIANKNLAGSAAPKVESCAVQTETES